MNDRISPAAAALTGSPAAEPHIAHAHVDGLDGAIDTFLALAERVKQRGEPLHTAPEILEARKDALERIDTIRRLL